VGVGDAFLRFDLLFGIGLGDGLGEAFFCFGEASGDGVGVAFFFRCLRVGVGDGSKTFLIFVPSDSSAASAAQNAPNNIATIKRYFIALSFRAKSRNLKSLFYSSSVRSRDTGTLRSP